jgi:methylthioribose-1-phosphate isomerase
VIQAVRWSADGGAVRIIDQTLLPERYEERDLRRVEDVCDAIARLAVRGAPAIGAAGAAGLVVSLAPFVGDSVDRFDARLREYAARIRATRATAVNLPWALDRMLACAERARRAWTGAPPRTARYSADRSSPASLVVAPAPSDAEAREGADNRAVLAALRAEATAILDEDRAMCRRIGEHALPLLRDGARVLTHCNAGALATAGIGTALAPVYLAAEAGRRIEVLVDETRPLLQGSRLTAWELVRAGISATVIADGAAASLMREGAVDLVIVGADRIAANGDVANKIGTYALAVAAQHHRIPFYVAAPLSTFDPDTPSGDAITIEERSPDELTCTFGRRTAPHGARVHNPAFDVTPAELVTAIVSDVGVHHPPYDFSAPGTRPSPHSR